jgi:uncharacterized membrane protein YdjX (TVP38/TMEM64 family)
MLPFDAVNFGCGLTAVRHRDYAVGTFIGILPSLIGFVLLGGVAAPAVQNKALIATLSVFFMLFGFAIAKLLKRREAEPQALAQEPVLAVATRQMFVKTTTNQLIRPA